MSTYTLFLYMRECRTWALIAQAAGWSPRAFLGFGVIQSGLVAFGGSSGSGSFYSDLWLSEDGGQTWREIQASGPAPGARAASRLVPLLSGDSRLVVAGWQKTISLEEPVLCLAI